MGEGIEEWHSILIQLKLTAISTDSKIRIFLSFETNVAALLIKNL
jgi:hypothetical protein